MVSSSEKSNANIAFLCIPINKLPSIPPFHDFDFYYKKEYFKRLNLLEEYFTPLEI